MDAKKYLLDIEKIFGSQAKIKLLKNLYTYKNIEQSITWFAKQSKISVNQSKLIIDEYKDLGIIDYRTIGKTSLINLKKNTIYYDLISSIIEKYDNIKKFFIDEIKNNFQDIKCEIWLYGSIVKNNLNKDSDIDILILFENSNKLNNSKKHLAEIQEKLSYIYQKPISFLVLTKTQYNKNYKDLKSNILFEGEKIYG